ncbi:MAG: hypothetical protein ACFFG0_38365 [Candidatus Thorarchaeota archaeon]
MNNMYSTRVIDKRQRDNKSSIFNESFSYFKKSHKKIDESNANIRPIITV